MAGGSGGQGGQAVPGAEATAGAQTPVGGQPSDTTGGAENLAGEQVADDGVGGADSYQLRRRRRSSFNLLLFSWTPVQRVHANVPAPHFCESALQTAVTAF